MGLAGQLFVEHNTIINLLLAGILSFSRYRRKLPILPAMVWLVAAILGCLVMFAVPVVFSIPGNRSEGYRSVGIGSIMTWIGDCASKVASFGSNFPPFGVIAVVGATAITTHLTKSHRKERWNHLIYSWLVMTAGYFALSDILLEGSWFPTYYGIQLLVTTGFALSAFLIWIVVLHPLENNSVKWGIYILLGLAFFSLAPFAVVSPAPVRVLFLPYSCTVAALFLFYPYAVKKLGAPFQLWLRRTLYPLTALTVLMLTVCFSNILWLNNLRATHIRSEMEQGKSSISIFAIPYDYVHWGGMWSYYNGFYYENPGDIAFTLEDFSTWYKTNAN